MSDFEERLTTALSGRAGATPDVVGLAEGARVRHRRRRTVQVVAGAVAGIAVVAAVPFGIGAMTADDPSSGIAAPAPELRSVPADWRFESYRDVEFAVPDDWSYGALSQYCISSDSRPVVERPNTASTLVACPTLYGFGVLVSEGAGPDISDPSSFPAGAEVRARTVDGITVTAIAKAASVADTVVESAAVYPGADYYGCEPQVDVPALGDMSAVGEFDRTEQIAVCRYDVGVPGANLVASEVLDQETQNEQAWLGVDSLEPGDGPNPDPGTCMPSEETQAVLFRSGGKDLFWVHYDGCTTHGVDVGGTVSQLNAQIMWAALGPNSAGGFGGEVPIPKERRQ